MSQYTITHSHADGTLIEGTSRGDDAIPCLKAAGWRWSRSIGQWYVPRSRHHASPTLIISATVRALEAAGHTVTLEIDDTPRPITQVEADLDERAQARRQAMAERAQVAQGRAETAWGRAHATAEQLPPAGEPIKVGHHSEGRHRRALERSHAAMDSAAQAAQAATLAQQRAEVAGARQAQHRAPVTVANRITRLEADQRRQERSLERSLDGAGEAARAHLTTELERTLEELTYWRGVRAEQIAAGQATDFSRQSVSVGDRVRLPFGWFTVVRVNAKTVTVRDPQDGWTSRVTYARILELREHPRATRVS